MIFTARRRRLGFPFYLRGLLLSIVGLFTANLREKRCGGLIEWNLKKDIQMLLFIQVRALTHTKGEEPLGFLFYPIGLVLLISTVGLFTAAWEQGRRVCWSGVDFVGRNSHGRK